MKEVNDFLPFDLAKQYYNFGLDVVTGKSGSNHVWTNQAWNRDIVRDSSVVICIKLPDEFLQELQDILQSNMCFDPKTDEPLTSSKSAIIYVWSKNSYIPVHLDVRYSKAVTVYLNNSWEYNDGGMFNWFDEKSQEWKNITPTFNKAVVNDSGYLHGITPVKSSVNRITLQIFLNPINQDTLRATL
jgi:hypothetical protein